MRRIPTLSSSLVIGLMALVFGGQAEASPRVHFQSTATLQGRVLDKNGAVVPRAQISAQNTATGLRGYLATLLPPALTASVADGRTQ